jgi:hypothetical protein
MVIEMEIISSPYFLGKEVFWKPFSLLLSPSLRSKKRASVPFIQLRCLYFSPLMGI